MPLIALVGARRARDGGAVNLYAVPDYTRCRAIRGPGPLDEGTRLLPARRSCEFAQEHRFQAVAWFALLRDPVQERLGVFLRDKLLVVPDMLVDYGTL